MKPRSMWGAHGPISVRVATLPFVDESNESLYGLYDADARTITIHPEITGYLRAETLEHEWVHSVLADCGCDQIITRDQNEWVAMVLGKALASRLHYSKRNTHTP